MRAAVLETSPGPLEVRELTVSAPARNEVLIRTKAAGLCHSDLHFLEGMPGAPIPVVMGHESAGVVEAIGSDVTYVAPGDRVIACLSIFCGRCEFCLTGRPYLCGGGELTRRQVGSAPRFERGGQAVNQFVNIGGFAEQMLVHENAVVKIGDEIPFPQAALIGCGVTTGLGAVINTAGVRPGDTVAVIGCGGVGIAAIQGAAISGAGRIIAVDLSGTKLEMATSFGATDTINASHVDPVGQVLDVTSGGVDHAFECIGLPATAEQAFGMLKRGGTATVVGVLGVGKQVSVAGLDLLGDRRLQGSTMGSNRFRVDAPKYVDMYLRGVLQLDRMVSALISLDDVNAGFEAMKSGEVARTVIAFD